MQNILVELEDWQSAALRALARANGEEVESTVQRLLAEQIAIQAQSFFDSLFSPSYRRYRQCNIEQRLQTLFAE